VRIIKNMTLSIDDIDKHVICHLMRDARNVSAPTIADDADVSAGTIRNRIRRLEEEGIIRGYHADIDYKRIDRMLTTLFVCEASAPESETLARQALDIPGVINVRELMPGRGNVQVKVVGTDTNELARIAADLSNLGLEIEHEKSVQHEYFHPYQPFSSDEEGNP
jgi:DNA-binding Lrp family transcriptional regulator